MKYSQIVRGIDYNSSDQILRAERLISEIGVNNYDIITMQEVYGEGKVRIVNQLEKMGYNLLQRGSNGKNSGFLTTIKNIIDKTGGLLTATKYPVIRYHQHRFQNHLETEAVNNQSFSLSLLSSKSPGFLLVGNLHLSSSSDEIRAKQLQEMHEVLMSFLSTLPEDVRQNCRIIIAGDFNIKSHKPEYLQIPEYLRLGDVFGQNQNFDIDIVTYSPENSYAKPNKPDDYGRIDYIFAPGMEKIESRVVKQPRGLEISDHYGVAASFFSN